MRRALYRNQKRKTNTESRNRTRKYTVTFERNGSMAVASRNDTPKARAISDGIAKQFATVHRALGIIGWPIRLPGAGGES